MTNLTAPEAYSTDVVMPASPRRTGRPSSYSVSVAEWLCEEIRRRGKSDTGAAVSLGIARSTLAGWKKEHPELEERLAMAREQFREAKLAIVDEAKTADGRPDWKAAVWALEKAFPEDYGKPARPPRRRAGRRASWLASASILERAFPEEFGEAALAACGGARPSVADSQGSPGASRPGPNPMGERREQGEGVRALHSAQTGEK
jgi:hypothetical protein